MVSRKSLDETVKATASVVALSILRGHKPELTDAIVDVAVGTLVGLAYENRKSLSFPAAAEPLYFEGRVLPREMVKYVA
jgi:hypothetical protein